MKRVLVVGWAESLNNMGDILLIDATSWICNQVGNFDIRVLDWDPSYEYGKKKEKRMWQVRMLTSVLFHSFGFTEGFASACKYWARKNWFDFYLKSYYRKAMVGIDAVIVAGGSVLKYETQDHSFYTECLLEVAKERGIPVMLNAAGIEQYSQNDVRCKHLIKTLNQSTVRLVTTRDDIEKLDEYFITNKAIKTALVADPAWWIHDVFNIEKKETRPPCIGINVVQENQFQRYGEYPISNDEMYAVYIDIIRELESKGYDWKIFCNGMGADYLVGKKLISMIGTDQSDKLMRKPTGTKEYVEMVSRFSGVVGGRMHALITAFALGIPFSAYVWSKKMTLFGEKAGIKDLFLEKENISGQNLVHTLEKAMSGEIDIVAKKEERKALMEQTIEYIREFSRSVI